jgi:hypothetical protein
LQEAAVTTSIQLLLSAKRAQNARLIVPAIYGTSTVIWIEGASKSLILKDLAQAQRVIPLIDVFSAALHDCSSRCSRAPKIVQGYKRQHSHHVLLT